MKEKLASLFVLPHGNVLGYRLDGALNWILLSFCEGQDGGTELSMNKGYAVKLKTSQQTMCSYEDNDDFCF